MTTNSGHAIALHSDLIRGVGGNHPSTQQTKVIYRYFLPNYTPSVPERRERERVGARFGAGLLPPKKYTRHPCLVNISLHYHRTDPLLLDTGVLE